MTVQATLCTTPINLLQTPQLPPTQSPRKIHQVNAGQNHPLVEKGRFLTQSLLMPIRIARRREPRWALTSLSLVFPCPMEKLHTKLSAIVRRSQASLPALRATLCPRFLSLRNPCKNSKGGDNSRDSASAAEDRVFERGEEFVMGKEQLNRASHALTQRR